MLFQHTIKKSKSLSIRGAIINIRFKGSTLIEVLAALGINSILMIGFVKLFIYFQNGYQAYKNQSEIVQSAYFLSHYIPSKIRMADIPCIDNSEINHQYFDESKLRQIYKIHGDILKLSYCARIKGHNQFHSFSYFVADTQRNDAKENPIRAIFELPWNGNRLELQSGIYEMKIYPIFSNSKSNPSAYELKFILGSGAPSEFKDWDLLVSLRNNE